MWADSTDMWKSFVANRVSASDHPADIASRGCTGSDIITKDIGGMVLYFQQSLNQPSLETQKSHASKILDIDILNYFSDLTRAMKVLCYMFRFYYNLNSKHTVSKMYFPGCNILSCGLVLHKNNYLICFKPFIDGNCFSRVNDIPLSPMLTYNERFPKLLPYNGRFTQLYLELIHKTSIHGENSLLLQMMRFEIWVP